MIPHPHHIQVRAEEHLAALREEARLARVAPRLTPWRYLLRIDGSRRLRYSGGRRRLFALLVSLSLGLLPACRQAEPPASDLTLTLSPDRISIPQGGEGTVAVRADHAEERSESVFLSLDVPDEQPISGTFTHEPASGSSTLLLEIAPDAPPGEVSLTLHAAAGSLAGTKQLRLLVTARTAPTTPDREDGGPGNDEPGDGGSGGGEREEPEAPAEALPVDREIDRLIGMLEEVEMAAVERARLLEQAGEALGLVRQQDFEGAVAIMDDAYDGIGGLAADLPEDVFHPLAESAKRVLLGLGGLVDEALAEYVRERPRIYAFDTAVEMCTVESDSTRPLLSYDVGASIDGTGVAGVRVHARTVSTPRQIHHASSPTGRPWSRHRESGIPDPGGAESPRVVGYVLEVEGATGITEWESIEFHYLYPPAFDADRVRITPAGTRLPTPSDPVGVRRWEFRTVPIEVENVDRLIASHVIGLPLIGWLDREYGGDRTFGESVEIRPPGGVPVGSEATWTLEWSVDLTGVPEEALEKYWRAWVERVSVRQVRFAALSHRSRCGREQTGDAGVILDFPDGPDEGGGPGGDPEPPSHPASNADLVPEVTVLTRGSVQFRVWNAGTGGSEATKVSFRGGVGADQLLDLPALAPGAYWDSDPVDVSPTSTAVSIDVNPLTWRVPESDYGNNGIRCTRDDATEVFVCD